jgi:hypothetical protein
MKAQQSEDSGFKSLAGLSKDPLAQSVRRLTSMLIFFFLHKYIGKVSDIDAYFFLFAQIYTGSYKDREASSFLLFVLSSFVSRARRELRTRTVYMHLARALERRAKGAAHKNRDTPMRHQRFAFFDLRLDTLLDLMLDAPQVVCSTK